MSTAQGWLTALAVGLVLMAGLLAGAETALARVSRVTVEELVRENRRGATKLAEVVVTKLPGHEPVEAADEVQRLRGPAARLIANMEASLAIPTATSVRAIPAKLLVDNRIVINNHLARRRGGKVSFTHLIAFAMVEAVSDMPVMNSAYVVQDDKPAVLTPAHVNLGLGAELAARITEQCFYSLEAPVLRVGGFDAPYPASRIEEEFLPDLDRLLDAVDRTFSF